jgi:hypothetical protein
VQAVSKGLAPARREAAAVRILAIDPGSQLSGYVELDDGLVAQHAKAANEGILQGLRVSARSYDVVVLESMSPRGMPTSLQEMEACFEAGRFAEAAHETRVERISRDAVKLHLTGRRAKVTDANVRAALIDRFGGVGGKDAAIGRKATPGPLYGIHDDEWAALALGVTWLDLNP